MKKNDSVRLPLRTIGQSITENGGFNLVLMSAFDEALVWLTDRRSPAAPFAITAIYQKGSQAPTRAALVSPRSVAP
jgi:hypothetical protein